jgi:hypothetical protein
MTKAEAESLHAREAARADRRTAVERKPCPCSLCGGDDRCVRTSLSWTVIRICNACLGHMLQELWTAQEPARRTLWEARAEQETAAA